MDNSFLSAFYYKAKFDERYILCPDDVWLKTTSLFLI